MPKALERTDKIDPSNPLVSCIWLNKKLEDPRVAIADVRGHVEKRVISPGVEKATYLADPDQYKEGHIPGAIFVSWVEELMEWKGDEYATFANFDQMTEVTDRLGLQEDSILVAYDKNGGQNATRLWWNFRLYGFENVVVLDGGLSAWKRHNFQLASGMQAPSGTRSSLKLSLSSKHAISASELTSRLNSQELQVIDARDLAQYNGDTRRGKRAGRIPGAVTIPSKEVFSPEGTALSPSDLNDLFEAKGIDKSKEIVVYCNGGMAATTIIHALHRVGAPYVRNYAESWNEWGNKQELPVEI